MDWYFQTNRWPYVWAQRFYSHMVVLQLILEMGLLFDFVSAEVTPVYGILSGGLLINAFRFFLTDRG